MFPCSFTASANIDYGEFLESVNGLSGNFQDRTYWALRVRKANNTVITPDVGMFECVCLCECVSTIYDLSTSYETLNLNVVCVAGISCYIPQANENVILNFTTY